MRNRLKLPIVLVLLCGHLAGTAAADSHVEVVETDEVPAAVEAGNVEQASEVAAAADSDIEVVEMNEGPAGAESGDVEQASEIATIVSLTPHSAEYRVKISVLSGRLNTSLVRTETGYEANHRIRATGLARMVSRGTIEEFSSFESTDSGIVPVHYVSNDSLSRDKTQADIYFNYESSGIMGGIRGTVNGESVEDILEDFAHDRVSIQYQLMRDLMNGGLAETYILFDIDEIKLLNVTVIGSREIRVPAGEFTALGVQHQAEGSSRVTTLWCVEELDYLPVMIEQHRHGELRMRASLRDYSPIEG